MEASYGILCFIPVIVVIILALITKRTLESLLGGILVGWLIVSGKDFIWSTVDSAINTIADSGTVWLLIVCGLFGSLILLLQKSGGAIAFGNYLGSKAKGEKSSLIITWLLGILIFADDYLNCLVIGSTMKKVTDKYKVSREYLSYVVDATAGPVCILLPFSTWAVYSAGLMEDNGLVAAGEGIKMYIQSIPFIIYPMVALILVPLTILGILPKLGPMKKADNRAKETGVLAPEGSVAMTVPEVQPQEGIKLNLWNFIIPMLVLIAVTIIYDVDLLKGTVAAVIVAILMFLPQKLMTFNEAFDLVVEGFKGMLLPLAIIIAAFMLKDVNDQLGLTPYVIDAVKPYMNGSLLPGLTFLVIGALGFLTGANWGTWAISMPIVIPLAQSAGVSIPLVLGAMWAAGGFGSHACPWGDATVLSSTACGCNNFDHVKTQFPYAMIGGGISFIIYLILGFVMA